MCNVLFSLRPLNCTDVKMHQISGRPAASNQWRIHIKGGGASGRRLHWRKVWWFLSPWSSILGPPAQISDIERSLSWRRKTTSDCRSRKWRIRDLASSYCCCTSFKAVKHNMYWIDIGKEICWSLDSLWLWPIACVSYLCVCSHYSGSVLSIFDSLLIVLN